MDSASKPNTFATTPFGPDAELEQHPRAYCDGARRQNSVS